MTATTKLTTLIGTINNNLPGFTPPVLPADLDHDLVVHKLVVLRLSALPEQDCITAVIALHQRVIDGDEPTEDEWSAVRSAAWSAAWSAESAARSAAWSAESTARSTARSAESAARSAARSTAWQQEADNLQEVLSNDSN